MAEACISTRPPNTEELNAFILRDGRALTELGRFLQEKERKE